MQFKTRSSAFVIALTVLTLGVGACGDPSTRLASDRPLDAATAVLVNGDPIYISDVELEAVAQGLVEPGDDFGPDHPDYAQILDQLIDQRLLAQEALRRGLDQDSDARRRLEAGRERLLGNILVENLVASEVTEAAIDRMYEEQVKLQQIDDEVRLRHILVDSQDEANQILQEIRAGRDFTEAAFEYSDDIRTRLDGGDFGWVGPNDMPDPFPAVIGNTETGAISEPFETDRGWHILKVDERRTRPPKTKEEMRPEIITFLTFTQISDILRELRADAAIQTIAEANAQSEVDQSPQGEQTDSSEGTENAITPDDVTSE